MLEGGHAWVHTHTTVGTEWILGSFHNVNEAFRRENGYLGRDFAWLTRIPAPSDVLGLVGPETTYRVVWSARPEFWL
jgi:hypothetical protein